VRNERQSAALCRTCPGTPLPLSGLGPQTPTHSWMAFMRFGFVNLWLETHQLTRAGGQPAGVRPAGTSPSNVCQFATAAIFGIAWRTVHHRRGLGCLQAWRNTNSKHTGKITDRALVAFKVGLAPLSSGESTTHPGTRLWPVVSPPPSSWALVCYNVLGVRLHRAGCLLAPTASLPL
jgi:hypothetical protein